MTSPRPSSALNVLDQTYIDKLLIELDGTPNKSRLGPTPFWGLLACAKAASESLGLSLYTLTWAASMPRSSPCR